MDTYIVNQQMLAHALAVTPQHLSAVKNQRRWTKEMAARIEELTGISQIELFTTRTATLNKRLRTYYSDQKRLKSAAQKGATR